MAQKVEGMRFHGNGAPRLGIAFSADNGTGSGGGQSGNNGAGDGGGDDGDDDNDDPPDLLKMAEALKKERQARKAAERELKPLKTAAQQKSEGEKSDAQKAQDRADAAERRAQQLEASVRQSNLERAVRQVNGKLNLGLHDSDMVADLLKLGEDDFDDDGKPIGLESKVKALLKEKPFLAGAVARRPGGGDGGAGNAGNGGTGDDMNARIRRAAGR